MSPLVFTEMFEENHATVPVRHIYLRRVFNDLAMVLLAALPGALRSS